MKLSSKVYINMAPGALKERVVSRAKELSLWVRFYSDGDKINEMCAAVTDSLYKGSKKNTTVIVSGMEELDKAYSAGFKHTAFAASVASSDDECDKMFCVKDDIGYVPPEQYKKIYSSAGVFRNDGFIYDFTDGVVTSRVSHKVLYLTDAQIYYLYKCLVAGDKTFNKGMGTRLRRTFGEGITSTVNLGQYRK